MRFTKFGKALAMGALSAGVIFGVTSCVESYTVGFLYVTGTVTASSPATTASSPAIKIDHNTGRLTPINGLPVSSGGANPVRAVLTLGSRFLYVLNRGVTASGNADCYGTGANACLNANITQFAVGGNGILTPQETFYTQGINPFRMFADGSGSYLFVLDHDAPDNANPSSTDNCALALGNSVTTCGDITVFKIDQTTGRLSLVENAPGNGGQRLSPSPISRFRPTRSILCCPAHCPHPRRRADTQPLTRTPAAPSSFLTATRPPRAVDAEPEQCPAAGHSSGHRHCQRRGRYLRARQRAHHRHRSTAQRPPLKARFFPLPWALAARLQAEPSGTIPDDPTLANPIYVLVESKGKFLYVANQGNNVTGPNPESGIAGYFLTTAPAYQLSFIAEEPFGSGSGPQCIVEDPSDQFIYEANQYDSTVTGRVLDPNTGDLNNLRVDQHVHSSRGRHRGAWWMGAQVSATPRPPAECRQRLAGRSLCQVRVSPEPARIDGLL